MVKRLTRGDIGALRRIEKIRRAKPFITYDKKGVVTRHRSLSKAVRIAKTQSLRGRRSYVDKDLGKFIRSIKVFEPKIKKKR